ncbi:MAG: UDP-N-acetylmuramoyl-tripeptide--D-alanyl-D-alanine ligase [Rhodobacterales bacterium]|nr:UDP-N-acetylmuramoyl-tripeptide--D-alanyl-D-alanine ligase [Rhodobacterales bacterium]
MKFDAQAIAEATGGTVLREAMTGDILTDTRALHEQSWFLALKGARFDAYDFLDQAKTAGSLGCIVSKAPPEWWTGGAVLVDDTTQALQDLGRYARSKMDVPVVGLTGSSGKTTTRALLALALSPLGDVHQTVGNLNNHLGVPMTLIAAPSDSAALVVEMGTSSHGEIAFLAKLATPTARLLLNIGPAHLLELGGLQGVAREKGALFDTARAGDVAVLNADDPHLRGMTVPDGVRLARYGAGEDVDVRLLSAKVNPKTLDTHATWRTPEGTFSATIAAPGRHIAHNAAGALAMAWLLGVPLQAATEALGNYQPVGMRLRGEDLGGGAVALNDAYNANPQSMEASLRMLADLPGRRVAVLGDMLELGTDEAYWHQQIVDLTVSLALDRVVLVGGLMSATVGGVNCQRFEHRHDVADSFAQWLQSGDTVLFKGSRGARVEQILHSVKTLRTQGDS